MSYGEYRAGDHRLKLTPGQVMFSDHQSQTAMPLAQVRSASGEQYSDGKISLFAKGDAAFVKVEGNMHYSNCQRQG